MTGQTKKYSNGEVTIVWNPDLCMHSRVCWNDVTGLPAVFNPKVRPWIKPEAATTQQIVDQIKKCPSGALSYFMNADEATHGPAEVSAETLVEQTPNGPLMVHGNVTVKLADGTTMQRNKVTAFCRCGGSGNKPFCDGTHSKIGFKG